APGARRRSPDLTLDRRARQIHHRIRPLEGCAPGTGLRRVPLQRVDAVPQLGPRLLDVAGENGDLMAVLAQRPDERRADKAGAAGDDDLHRSRSSTPSTVP